MELLKNRHTYVTIKSSVCNILEVEMKKDIHTLNSPKLNYLTLREPVKNVLADFVR